jgi:hypothetical protein
MINKIILSKFKLLYSKEVRLNKSVGNKRKP